MSILWTIIIGFIAGVIAKLITPGRNEPSGFILTTILGIIGAFVATYLGQAIGWYRAGEGAGLIGAVVGAVIVLVIWSMIAGRAARRRRTDAESLARPYPGQRKSRRAPCPTGSFCVGMVGCRHGHRGDPATPAGLRPPAYALPAILPVSPS